MARYLSLTIVVLLAFIAILTTGKLTDTKNTASKNTGTKTMNISMKTNHGTITLELYPDKAPITVENFVSYIKDGHFNGTIFHRVIPGFMIQGGGFLPDMSQKDTKASIKNEADNGLSNDNGTIAMARTPDPDSASSQFFINVKDNSFLNYSAPTPQGWGYCVFGKVTDGMDIVNKIENVATASSGMHQDVPVDAVMIEEVSIIQADAAE